MNELTVTISGWVATDPKLTVVPGGADLVTFRLATTSRYFDRANNEWRDRDTEWFTVRVFRAAGQLVSRSLRKGQPVLVVGRLHSHEWKADSGVRVDLVIDAQAVGHDLTKGVADFTRAVVETPAGQAAETAEPPRDEPIDEASVEDVSDEFDEELGEPVDADDEQLSLADAVR